MTNQSLASGANKISFKSKGINLVGDLYLPADFDPAKTYEGIVMTPPFPQVKDQVLANYGPKLAERGYVALAFDYNSKGESDTYQEEFSDDEDFPRKWEDLCNAPTAIFAWRLIRKKDLRDRRSRWRQLTIRRSESVQIGDQT